MTSVGCLLGLTARRTAGDETHGLVFTDVDGAATFTLRTGGSPDRAILHVSYAASNIVLRRAADAPPSCARKLPDSPISNFETFAATWAEQYGFFDIKKADWPSIVSTNRSRVTPATTPQELFAILSDMIEPFQ